MIHSNKIAQASVCASIIVFIVKNYGNKITNHYLPVKFLMTDNSVISCISITIDNARQENKIIDRQLAKGKVILRVLYLPLLAKLILQ